MKRHFTVRVHKIVSKARRHTNSLTFIKEPLRVKVILDHHLLDALAVHAVREMHSGNMQTNSNQ